MKLQTLRAKRFFSHLKHCTTGCYTVRNEKFWRIYLYLTDEAIATLFGTKGLVKLREMVENFFVR